MTAFETRTADWLPYPDAIARILAHARPLDSETVPFEQGIGRALAQDLTAPRSLPEHDNSAMDGYAVRAEDVRGASSVSPIELEIVGEALPGAPWGDALRRGGAVRIMTGAAVPEGADSVIRVEHTDARGPSHVRINTDADADRNVRPAGEDMEAGQLVATRGATLYPGHVAVLTSTGHLDVPVGGRPRVALLSTGDELVSVAKLRDVGSDLEARERLWADRIVDSNTPMLKACVEDAGGLPSVVGIARDNKESLRTLLQDVGEADVLITTGGASMGTHDLLKRVMDELGFVQDFWRVRIRPGSPISMGFLPRAHGTPLPVFGLPGNPASAFVTFELFVRPFLLALAGHADVQRPVVQATATEVLRGPADLDVFLRVALSGEAGARLASLTGPQGSGLVSSLGQADGLARLDEGIGVVEPGDSVDVLVLRTP